MIRNLFFYVTISSEVHYIVQSLGILKWRWKMSSKAPRKAFLNLPVKSIYYVVCITRQYDKALLYESCELWMNIEWTIISPFKNHMTIYMHTLNVIVANPGRSYIYGQCTCKVNFANHSLSGSVPCHLQNYIQHEIPKINISNINMSALQQSEI